MFLSYKHIELMLAEKSNTRYFFYDILWLRGLLAGAFVFGLVSLAFRLFDGQHLLFYQYSFLILIPIINFTIAGFLMLITEKLNIKNFTSLNNEMRFSKLKIICVLNLFFWLLALMMSSSYNFGDTSTLTLSKFLVNLVIVIVLASIFGLLFGLPGFRKLRAEIEKNGMFERF